VAHGGKELALGMGSLYRYLCLLFQFHSALTHRRFQQGIVAFQLLVHSAKATGKGEGHSYINDKVAVRKKAVGKMEKQNIKNVKSRAAVDRKRTDNNIDNKRTRNIVISMNSFFVK
jgi:ribosomal protein L35AE/L33A